jgi:phage tail sheath protein FI
MGTNFTYPGVYIQEIPSTVHTIVPAPTAVAAFVGRARRGPINTPVRIHSYADFQRTFGGLWANSEMPYSVQQYFLNGGSDAYIVRAISQAVVSAQSTDAATLPIPTSAGALSISAQNPGSWFLNVTIAVDWNTRKINGVRRPDEFNLTMTYREVDPVTGAATATVETFPNVSYLAGSANFITPTLSNDSNFIQVESGSAVPQARPAPGSHSLSGPIWGASTSYQLQSMVIDPNGNEQVVTAAGTSAASRPNWNPAVDGTTTDGTVTWTNQGPVTLQLWQSNKQYRQGQVIFDGIHLQRVTAGAVGATSGGAAPNPWNGTPDQTTNDGGLTWTNETPALAGVAGWLANHAYNLNDKIYDSNGNVQELTAAPGGWQSGAVAPNPWNAIPGETTNDNGGTWTNQTPGQAGVAAWIANHQYNQGDRVYDSNGNVQRMTVSPNATTGAAAPAWKTPAGAVTSGDGGASWVNLGPTPNIQNRTWLPQTAYVLGAQIVDSNGNLQMVTTAGNSGTGLPNWAAALNGHTADGTVTWTNVGAVLTGIWSPLTYYPTGAEIYDSNGNLQQATAGGTSGVTAPTWGAGAAAVTVDGSIEWTWQNATGISDGAALAQADLTAQGLRLAKNGIYALLNAEIFTIMVLPPYAPQENNGTVDLDTTYAGIWGDALAFCKSERAILLVDPPSPNVWSDERHAYQDLTGATPPVDPARDPNSAMYYPWLNITDPLQGSRPRYFAPSATVAGVMAGIDSSRGVWKSPAGEEATMLGVAGLQYLLNDAENGDLNPLGINCLRTFPILGSVVWGARTLDGADVQASEWKYLAVRRMALFIEDSLYRGTGWAVFEPNDTPLWSELRLNVGSFMQTLFRHGAFQGTTPQQAYFVKCDSDTTTQADIDSGVVNVLVGFAPLKPAEFVVIQISQITGGTPS